MDNMQYFSEEARQGNIDKTIEFIKCTRPEVLVIANGKPLGKYILGQINVDDYTIKLTPVRDPDINCKDENTQSFYAFAPTGYEENNTLITTEGTKIELRYTGAEI